MKTQYKYFRFEERPSKGKTGIWFCRSLNGDEVLGRIKWYTNWRCYIFEARIGEEQFDTEDYTLMFCGTIFNETCLADIQDFIKQLMDARAQEVKA